MPSDYKNVSLKMMYPWQGANQQQLVQSPVMINETSSSSSSVTNQLVNSNDSQLNHHHSYTSNNNNNNHVNQGQQNSNNYFYNNLSSSSCSSSSSQQQQQQQQQQYQLPQNLRVSSGSVVDDDGGNLVNLNDYDSQEKETIIDQLIFNLNGKLTLNNNADTYECHSLCKERRLSPYSTTGHTSDCTNYHLLNSTETNLTSNTDDPAYRLMQQLIKEGALIKEAVRRLQFTKSESPITL